MQNRRSWEGGFPSELEDVCRRKVALRSFIEAGWSTYAEQIILPSNRAAATSSSLKTVYDLAAKRRVGLRFNCKNLTSKCASLRFTCNRQPLSNRLDTGRSPQPLQAAAQLFLVETHVTGQRAIGRDFIRRQTDLGD